MMGGEDEGRGGWWEGRMMGGEDERMMGREDDGKGG